MSSSLNFFLYEFQPNSESYLSSSYLGLSKKMNSLKIFCRIRPIIEGKDQDRTSNDGDGDGNHPIQTSQSSREIERKIKCIDSKTISLCDLNSLMEQRIVFDQVFDETFDQIKIFDSVGRPLLRSLLKGEDVLMFAYGVTSSGKSYTINGTPQSPGLIPRALIYLFDRIVPEQLVPFNKIISTQQNDFLYNDQMDSITTPTKSNQTFIEDQLCPFVSLTKKFQKTLFDWSTVKMKFNEENSNDDRTLMEPFQNKRFALFISFVEIYNNYIYDLLEVPQSNSFMEWHRTPRQLVNDHQQMVYVQGSREIQCISLDQAFKVYLFGLQNRRLSQTELNDTSSRSHSVFTIKLVNYDDVPIATDDFQLKNCLKSPKLSVNQFSIVDLAGLERTKRTKNTKTTLFEASNINNSLMTLRSCFDAMKKNMSIDSIEISSKNIANGSNVKTKKFLIPYRQSKLTYFLKRFFEFPCQIRMMICIKPHIDDFNENKQVLMFGKKAQKIIIPLSVNQQQKPPQPTNDVRVNDRHQEKIVSKSSSTTTASSGNDQDEEVVGESSHGGDLAEHLSPHFLIEQQKYEKKDGEYDEHRISRSDSIQLRLFRIRSPDRNLFTNEDAIRKLSFSSVHDQIIEHLGYFESNLNEIFSKAGTICMFDSFSMFFSLFLI